MRDISGYPLLTPEDEVTLGHAVRKGDDDARVRFITSNLRLVVTMAGRFKRRGLTLMEIVAAGNDGLALAVDGFNPENGARFSSYASWYIRRSIYRVLARQTRTIRLPLNVIRLLGKIRRAADVLSQDLAREPTNAELAAHLGIRTRRVARVLAAGQSITSLDAPASAERDAPTLASLVPDTNAEDPSERVVDAEAVDVLREQFKDLSPRCAMVLRLRYGIDGTPPMSLEEVGRRLNVTAERARQIESAAKTLLRRRLIRAHQQPLDFIAPIPARRACPSAA